MTIEDIQAARRELARLADAPKPVSRSVFSAWSPERQSLFCRAGGTIIPDPKPARRAAPLGQSHAPATRADFLAVERDDLARAKAERELRIR
jgi:hypothetical protein